MQLFWVSQFLNLGKIKSWGDKMQYKRSRYKRWLLRGIIIFIVLVILFVGWFIYAVKEGMKAIEQVVMPLANILPFISLSLDNNPNLLEQGLPGIISVGENFSSKEIAVVQDFSEIKAALNNYYRQYKTYPANLKELAGMVSEGTIPINDPWGSPYFYFRVKNDVFALGSRGSNVKWDQESLQKYVGEELALGSVVRVKDDIFVKIRYVSPDDFLKRYPGRPKSLLD